MAVSAGILPFRRTPKGVEVLIAHPGGPLWSKKDAGAWSIVKGEQDDDEDLTVTARREFEEETGWKVPDRPWLPLGEVTLRSGKRVVAWAVEADFDPDSLEPGAFTMRWRGRTVTFPEIDRVRWCPPEEAKRLLNPAQSPLVDRLVEMMMIQ